MTTRAAIALSLLLNATLACAEVTLDERTPGSAIIATPAYEATIDTRTGLLASVTDLRTGRELGLSSPGLVIVEERDRDEWSEAWTPSPTEHREADATAQCRFERRDGALACVSEWSCPAGSVTRTATFSDEQPVVTVSYELRAERRIEQVGYRLQTRDPKLFAQARSYPADERILSRGDGMARHDPAPALVHCWDGETGLGIMAGADARAVAHAIEPGPNVVQLAAYSQPLRWTAPPFDARLELRLAIGATPDEALALHRTLTPGLPAAEIARLDVDRLVHWLDEPGAATATVRCNSTEPQTVRVQATVSGGIADELALPEQSLQLAPGEAAQVRLQWPAQAEWGHELAVRLIGEDGAELDVAREAFAASDNFSRVGQIVVFNPGWMNSEWQIDRRVEWARRNAIGTIEYYCWAPDQVFDLTPDTEVSEPHTESQRAYRAELTRTFLQGLVTEAHEGGLRVLAMDTGMASLPGALSHPERIRYTAEGQLYLYNGNIHDGRRLNAVPAHIFTTDRIRDWANEMAACVDMFGWDGVRFDWNFLPVSAQDPLYLGSEEDADKHVWYDWQGRSSHELFPQPDATAAELCQTWRETVAARHPRFVYHGNYQVNEEMLGAFPQYSRTVCASSGILREGLLNVAIRYPTWQEWTAALMDTTRTIRPLDGQPSVGWMRGYAPGSVAHRVLQYCMIASGYHWYGTASARHSIDDTWTRFGHAMRFSEYFYAPDFLPAADAATVSGEGAERVLWQPFVYARERDGLRETLVHLVNLPASDHIIQRHEVPPVREGLTVTVSLPAGMEVAACHALVPDPQPHAEALEWQPVGEGRVQVTLPELREMASVLVVAQ